MAYTITPSDITIDVITYLKTTPTTISLLYGNTLRIDTSETIKTDGQMTPEILSSAANGVPFTLTPSDTTIIEGQTLTAASPTTVNLPDGKVVQISQNRAATIDRTPISLSLTFKSIVAGASLTRVTADGLTSSVGATQVSLCRTAYIESPGAQATRMVIDGQTVCIGSGGVGLRDTTIPPRSPRGGSTIFEQRNYGDRNENIC